MIPEVGMGATKQVGSDSYAYTIIDVVNDRKIVVQADHQHCTSGNQHNSEVQEWECKANPNGAIEVVTLRKNGRWVPLGQDKNSSGFGIGFRKPHYDPHF